jgi:hypothetical protein
VSRTSWVIYIVSPCQLTRSSSTPARLGLHVHSLLLSLTFSLTAATSGLAAALESCSYRKEFILLATTPDVLDNALQLHNALFNLGLAHAVLLAPDSATCSDATRVRPDLCCVWSSLELPQETFPHQLALWHHRRRLSARAVRLGYNTLVGGWVGERYYASTASEQGMHV